MGRADAEEVSASNVDQGECGTHVGLLRGDFDVAELEIFHVADEESRGGKRPEHGRLWVLLLVLRRLEACHLRGAAAKLMQVDIADFHVFDEVSGYAAEDGRQLSRGIAGDIADEDALESPHGGIFWPAHTLAEA